MNENIDTTQWLPRNTPVINTFRDAQGDLRGEVKYITVPKGNGTEEIPIVTYAEVRDVSTLAKLIELGYLDHYHRWYGLTLLELSLGFAGPTGFKINSAALVDALGGGVSKNQAGKMYDDIIRQFTLPRKRLVEKACNEMADDTLEQEMVCNAYRQCFELLVCITDEVISKTKEEIEKGIADA